MTTEPFRLAELCSGYGGLGLGLQLAGIDHHVTWYAETDPDAAAVMAAHTAAPNLGDITTITNCPPVDIVTAGFPCQPVSTAGARQGVNDARWLIRDVVAVWQRSSAHWLLLENVPGLLSANDGEAFGQVIDSLAEVGATAKWTHLRASDVGAPHRRERWFCIARHTRASSGRDYRSAGRSDLAGGRGRPAPNSNSCEPERRRVDRVVGGQTQTESRQGDQRQRTGHTPGGRRAADADTDVVLCELERVGRVHDGPRWRNPDGCDRARFGGYAEAVRQWEHITCRTAPDPTVDGRLSAEFVEWMQGLPPGWVTHHTSRRQALRILGNGVVPQQAAAAIEELAA